MTNPARRAAPREPSLPRDFRVVRDPATRQLERDVLFGGVPVRVVRLSDAGCAALAELNAGPIRTTAAARLARRLTDAGLAHPRPPKPTVSPSLTVLDPRPRPSS